MMISMNPGRILSATAKAAIALGGLLAALVLLELGIRATGSAAKYLQNRSNANALAEQGTIRVLCIGDSMTFNQYPPFLAQLLNHRHDKRFNVIDCGFPRTTSSDTLAALKNQLDSYKPHMVIAMTGENDKTPGRILLGEDFAPRKSHWLESLRLYRLYHYTVELLLKHKLQATPPALTFRHTSKELPKSAQPELAQIGSTIADKNTATAEKLLKDFLSRYPEAAQARFWLGLAYMNSQRRREASEQFELALSQEPDNYKLLCALGELHAEAPDKTQAKSILEKATNLDPKEARAYLLLGEICLRSEELACAEDNLQKAVTLSPHDNQPLDSLGLAYIQSGQYKKAAETLNHSLRLKPDNQFALSILVDALCLDHQYEAALEAALRLLNLKDGARLAYQRLSKVYLYMCQITRTAQQSKIGTQTKMPAFWVIAANRARYYLQPPEAL
ncbi:MAG TPA: tetratricopeptide repeat protein, partial [Elusimicrobiales bacterium]|nr:tetratricopeptide repeat protein [Elusimicrobiales bacterium]